MKRNTLRVIKYSLLIFLVIYLYKIFWPRNYIVPESQLRGSTKYWNLSTGSQIGYTSIAGMGSKMNNPIIYLHGGPGGFVSDRDIRVLSALAEDGHDIYLYDQIGSGQSARLKNIYDYTVVRHVKDLKEIVSKVSNEKVILMGQSWGAILVTLFTADNSEKVEKIILFSPAPIYPIRQELKNVTPPDSLHLRNPFYSNNQGNEKANNLRIKTITFCATKSYKKLASDKEVDNYASYLNFEVNKSTVCDTANILKAVAGSGFYAAVMTFKSLDLVQDPRPKLKNSNIPILVIKGQCDNQKWGFTNEYLELFRNHQFAFIPDAGHFISVEQPESYLKAIKRFLSK
jgi:proline iminopeptidase